MNINAVKIISTTGLTMDSLKLLEVINQYREEEGKSAMAHRNFIQKIEDELEGDELKFQSVYLAGNGEESKCYELPNPRLFN